MMIKPHIIHDPSKFILRTEITRLDSDSEICTDLTCREGAWGTNITSKLTVVVRRGGGVRVQLRIYYTSLNLRMRVGTRRCRSAGVAL